MTTNFINYLRRLGAPSATAAVTVNVWSGFCYLSPLLGGWIADSILGRFKTIFVFSIVYLMGSVLLTMSAAIPGIRVEDGDVANAAQWMLLAICLLLFSIGSGGLKPNVSSFGADQFDDAIERDRREKQSFFNWLYFFINIGSVVASILVVYIQDQGKWAIGFGIPGEIKILFTVTCSLTAVVLFVAVVVFFIGKPKYKILSSSESPPRQFFKVTRTALSKSKTANVPLPSLSDNDRAEFLVDDDAENESPEDIQNSQEMHETMQKKHWLDQAIGSGGLTAEQVNEVKLVYNMFPFFFMSIIYYPLLILQGGQMERDVSIFNIDFRMPAASMILFNPIAIVISIPVYELLVLPGLKRFFNYSPTTLQRVGAGLLLNLMAALSFYAIEWRRLQLFSNGRYHLGEEKGDGEIVEMSIWWQTVPHVLIGITEVLTWIGLVEFYYDQAPDSMRSTMSSINLFAVSLSSYFSSLLLITINAISTAAGHRWITDNLNVGHLDYYILVVAGLATAVFLWFLWTAAHYQYKDICHAQVGDTVDDRHNEE